MQKQDNKAIKSFCSSQTYDPGHTSQIQSPLKDLNVIISPSEVNYHRKVKLEDANINKKAYGLKAQPIKDFILGSSPSVNKNC